MKAQDPRDPSKTVKVRLASGVWHTAKCDDCGRENGVRIVGPRPKLLDLFCGAGGAGEGYRRAGFDVTGVDIEPQPNNPHRFVQADALEYLESHGDEYDAIHASPPCQSYSRAMRHLATPQPMLIEPVRKLFKESGKAWVIENVLGAPLVKWSDLFGNHGVELCGTMFGLRIYRHRIFETSFPIYAPKPCDHSIVPLNPHRAGGDPGGPISGRARMKQEFGEDVNCEKVWAEEMGVGWMSKTGAREAVPPCFTEYIGRHLRALGWDTPPLPASPEPCVWCGSVRVKWAVV